MNRWLSRFFSWNINPNLSKNINAEKSMAENDKLSFTNENETLKTNNILTREKLLEKLTPEQYYVTQEKGTERPFSGKYNYNKESGLYKCIACNNTLFSSTHKYDSGSGWPSFYKVFNEESVKETSDFSHGMRRVEVSCSNCHSHLGHVFKDGPMPTGQRYCINSASMDFEKLAGTKQEE